MGVPDRIELFNPQGAPVDLSGWAISMDDLAGERRDYLLAPGASIEAGGYLVLSDEGGPNAPPPDTPTDKFAGFNITWDASRGGAVWLVDPNGIALDYVEWLNAAGDAGSGILQNLPYDTLFALDDPLSAPSADQSLGRDGASADTDSTADWENTGGSDAIGPTFGDQNIFETADSFNLR